MRSALQSIAIITAFVAFALASYAVGLAWAAL
jgi:hypothetical protein